MMKIRINELARELEVKPKVIVDLLPGFGVTEKKTHSSSVDEDVAEKIRIQLIGGGASTIEVEEEAPEPAAAVEQPHAPAKPEPSPKAVAPAEAAIPPSVLMPSTVSTPVAAASESGGLPPTPEGMTHARPAPLRPPLASGLPGAAVPHPIRPTIIPAKPVPPAALTPRPGQIISGPRQPMPASVAPATVAATLGPDAPRSGPSSPRP
ncbi:MAG TPA: translation initiation factor IF-2 N-terminal domain-containing protein, partial [Candidatus Dormibacteraeota bacterium]|nr:translation initiation factor IF-2 N-terminal domain-containing protein [Candidatus Dormibacteraeota bacterium]